MHIKKFSRHNTLGSLIGAVTSWLLTIFFVHEGLLSWLRISLGVPLTWVAAAFALLAASVVNLIVTDYYEKKRSE